MRWMTDMLTMTSGELLLVGVVTGLIVTATWLRSSRT